MRTADRTTRASRACRSRGAGRAAFTLIELLVVIAIVVVVLSVLVVGFRAARLGADARTEEASARAMAFSVETFREQVGFLPPLVHDGDPMTVPVPRKGSGNGPESFFSDAPIDPEIDLPGGGIRFSPATYNPRFSQNLWFLRGRQAPVAGDDRPRLSDAEADQRYSKFSVPYYVAGVLGSVVDGVDSGGGADDAAMAEPLRSGAFRGVVSEQDGSSGQTFSRVRLPSFFEWSEGDIELVREYFDAREYREHSPSAAPVFNREAPQARFLRAFVSDSGRAFRYYRWEPGGFYRRGAGFPAETPVRNVLDYNIPTVLLDPVAFDRAKGLDGAIGSSDGITPSDDDTTIDPTADPSTGIAQPQLKGARWAIVSTGPDGLFGTESIEDLNRGLRSGRIVDLPPSLRGGVDPNDAAEVLEARRWARSDNAVEVGR